MLADVWGMLSHLGAVFVDYTCDKAHIWKTLKNHCFFMFLVVQGVHIEDKLGYVEAMLRHLESMLGHPGPM